jgi:PAS domain S-box-containing protein
MYRASFQQSDAFLSRSMRVLLCMANARDRQLVADQLASESLDIVRPDGADELPQFDLCVVDTQTYPTIADTIERRRKRLGTIHLPVLLVLGPSDSEAALGPHSDRIDDVIAVPTSGEIFKQRVKALLRIKKQSEQLALFARAMDDANSGITIADAGGDQELRYVNDAFLEITGYDREEALGRNCRFLQGPETDPKIVRELRRAIDEQEPVSVTIRNYRKDGTMFWNRLEMAPVRSERGVSHFVGFQKDITEEVEQRRELQRFEDIVNAASDPIYALDSDLRFTLLNGATAALCDRPASDIRGSRVETVFGESHAEVLEAAVLDLADSGAGERVIGTVVDDTEGRQRRFQTTVATLGDTEFEGVACVSRDITADRERESRLSVLDRVLRHNLRNKLMVMLAQAEEIRAQDDKAAINHSAETIERAGEELLELAETARDFSRTVDPEDDDTVGPVDVGAHTCHAVEETRMEFGSATFDADVPDSQWARAHDSFELAMTELLERAANAGESVAVAVNMAEADGKVEITVTHNGASLETVEREALNAGVESDLKHTIGLGLWFVRWMAINSGGTFAIHDSDPGTRIELTLPTAAPPQ